MMFKIFAFLILNFHALVFAENLSKGVGSSGQELNKPQPSKDSTQDKLPSQLIEQNPAQSEGEKGQLSSPSSREEFEYDPTVLRDPFMPSKSIFPEGSDPDLNSFISKSNKKENPQKVETDPLLKLDLATVDLAAVILDPISPRALIVEHSKDDAGKAIERFYTIYRNTKIGMKNGVVSAIKENEVVITEMIESQGVRNYRTVYLRVNK